MDPNRLKEIALEILSGDKDLDNLTAEEMKYIHRAVEYISPYKKAKDFRDLLLDAHHAEGVGTKIDEKNKEWLERKALPSSHYIKKEVVLELVG